VIFVLDRGPGIPEHEREAVFRPFYRLEQSRNRRTGGSGLGLAVARQLAVANGFEIHLGPPGGRHRGNRDTAPSGRRREAKPEPKSG
jgi:two-component system, OmpR family, osmolarity sensor histidine kinase EnvZ